MLEFYTLSVAGHKHALNIFMLIYNVPRSLFALKYQQQSAIPVSF